MAAHLDSELPDFEESTTLPGRYWHLGEESSDDSGAVSQVNRNDT